jgi:hypothetical protein
MKNGKLLQTHELSPIPRQILQDGRIIAHQRCARCARDFAFELDGSGWHAVYLGVFRVEPLDEKVNQRWLSEECPKQIVPADNVDRATRQGADLRFISNRSRTYRVNLMKGGD